MTIGSALEKKKTSNTVAVALAVAATPSEVHPAAALFSMIDEEFSYLVRDIQEHGLHNPIAVGSLAQ